MRLLGSEDTSEGLPLAPTKHVGTQALLLAYVFAGFPFAIGILGQRGHGCVLPDLTTLSRIWFYAACGVFELSV